MIKAVFFDLYQTLVRYDPPREQIIAATLGEFGIEVKPEQFVGPLVAADEFIYQSMARRPLGQQSSEERMALYIRHLEILFEKAGITVEPSLIPKMLMGMQESNSSMVLFDDVIPTLDDLKNRGIILGLISNIDTDMTDTLRGLGLDTRLNVVMTSREAGVTKPKPEIFLAALKKAGVSAGDSLFIGDQYEIDVAGAQAAGMTGILLDRTGFYTSITDCPRITGLAEVTDYL
ncbi:MAG: HAD family hydrolase [Dehalococcoidales bacterium]|nr:HAD family hydrolase [Dehalococcoidales bacterium]